ncbi:hypothetical protein [Streptomyces klenkii]|uniref:hypothetical protein n=1 Tax=Streptomyces klenkii TaxID=1420899 RepID=UPI00343B0BC3
MTASSPWKGHDFVGPLAILFGGAGTLRGLPGCINPTVALLLLLALTCAPTSAEGGELADDGVGGLARLG